MGQVMTVLHSQLPAAQGLQLTWAASFWIVEKDQNIWMKPMQHANFTLEKTKDKI